MLGMVRVMEKVVVAVSEYRQRVVGDFNCKHAQPFTA